VETDLYSRIEWLTDGSPSFNFQTEVQLALDCSKIYPREYIARTGPIEAHRKA
jgi:hypothetical protein